jgi:hypothetical protein
MAAAQSWAICGPLARRPETMLDIPHTVAMWFVLIAKMRMYEG